MILYSDFQKRFLLLLLLLMLNETNKILKKRGSMKKGGRTERINIFNIFYILNTENRIVFFKTVSITHLMAKFYALRTANVKFRTNVNRINKYVLHKCFRVWFQFICIRCMCVFNFFSLSLHFIYTFCHRFLFCFVSSTVQKLNVSTNKTECDTKNEVEKMWNRRIRGANKHIFN